MSGLEDEQANDGQGILHPEGMKAVQSLALGVVHEINNVLGVIIGNSHLAKKHAGDAQAVERYLGEVRTAAEQGREVMRQLGALAGERTGRRRKVALNDLIHQATAEVEVPVELGLSEPGPTVQLDLWLGQDAVRGALAFMANTHSVRAIRVATRIFGRAAMLTLEDDGPSPTEDELGALFMPFSRLQRRPKPGLHLTKLAYLASQVGGHVSTSSVRPQGLRIVLTLPAVDDAGLLDSPGMPLPKEGM